MLCCEDESMLRSRQNYNIDLLLKDPSITGIKEECVFHRIDKFYITENLYCDIMHDVQEGIGSCTIEKVLTELILSKVIS